MSQAGVVNADIHTAKVDILTYGLEHGHDVSLTGHVTFHWRQGARLPTEIVLQFLKQ